jgi:hypothetical protein
MVPHMGFKYSLYAAIAVAALSGCYAPPSTDEAFEESVVITSHDDGADFGQFRTFYVRPQVRLLDEELGVNENPEFVADTVAAPLVNTTRDNLRARGFAEAASKEEADLAVELVYLRSVNSQQYCYAYYGWYDYYWGYYYPYYPYCDTSVWRSGTLVSYAMDMDAAIVPVPPLVGDAGAGGDAGASVPDKVLRTVWTSAIYGAEVDSVQYVEQRAIAGINQAFIQSPYFTAAP